MFKNLAELIDALNIVNIKLYMIMEGEETVENFKKLKILNKQRSELKNAINNFIGEENEEVKNYN